MKDTTKKRVAFSTQDSNVSGPGTGTFGAGEKRKKTDRLSAERRRELSEE